MTVRDTDSLIAALAAEARAVRPLASPVARAAGTLGLLALAGLAAVLLLPTVDPLALRGPGAELLAGAEQAAVLLTGILAVIAAFHLAIPGRSRRWLLAPLPAFVLWLGLSGLGCWRDLVRNGPSGFEAGHSMDCLGFILLSSLLIGPLVAWRLSRAAPIDPVPVAAMGGLGIAALSAFLLQFFHPFAVTFIDLAFHLAAVAIVTTIAVLLRRPILRAA